MEYELESNWFLLINTKLKMKSNFILHEQILLKFHHAS